MPLIAKNIYNVQQLTYDKGTKCLILAFKTEESRRNETWTLQKDLDKCQEFRYTRKESERERCRASRGLGVPAEDRENAVSRGTATSTRVSQKCWHQFGNSLPVYL